MTYTEVEALLALDRPAVALIPSGSTEAHGPHLPLATDSIISDAMATAAAELIAATGRDAVVFPTLHYAVTDWAASFAGSTTISKDTAGTLLLECCVAAREMGFDAVVLINAHLEPDNIATLRDVARRYAEARGEPLIFPDVTRRAFAQQLGEEFKSGSCHAGSYETSLVMAARPDLVREDIAAGLPDHIVPLHERIRDGAKNFADCGLDRAYCGWPARASADEGRALIETLATVTATAVADHFARD
jgi:creatinine amidohydrolase